MQKLLRIFLVLTVVMAAPLSAQKPKSAPRAGAAEDIGTVEVSGLNAISITLSGSPELLDLANLAFNSHGRYRRVASRGTFDLRFSSVGANQVRVDVMKGGQAVLSQTVGGTSTRNALFRAADVAVKATSGLNGWFASRLAFVSERSGKSEIFVSDAFMGEARQITRDNAHALSPRWSPDGTRLLYTSFYKSGFPDIFLINLSTQQRSTFLSLKGTNTGARFSPTGNQVAMVLSGEGNPEIYVSNAQGRGISRRTRTDGVESSPCFSPDGSQIVYAGEPGPQLYVMSAAGGGTRRLTSGISSYCAEPDWSRADPSKIVFTMREGGAFRLALLDVRTGSARRVETKVAARDVVEPTWLADGRHVVCTGRSANSRHLYIVDTETGKATRLSTVQAEKASAWSN